MAYVLRNATKMSSNVLPVTLPVSNCCRSC